MKALVHDGNGHIALEDRLEPQLRVPTDAIVRVTRSTICTSDLHIIHGAVPAPRRHLDALVPQPYTRT